MKCPINGKPCMKYKAFHVTDIIDKKPQIVNVCEDCLCKLDDKNILREPCEKEIKEKSPSCSFCGLTLDELLKNSRLGCEKCYDTFEKPLIIAFEKLQRTPEVSGELRHVGKAPFLWKKEQAKKTDPRKFLLELKQKLAISVKEEEYKIAKQLKDYITAFESFLSKFDEFKNDPDQQLLILDQMAEFIYYFREKELKE